MSHTEWRLAARVIGTGPPNESVMVSYGDPGTMHYYQVVPGQVPIYRYPLPTTGSFPHNVFGIEVYPD
jgi:hypothetical protein